MNALKVTLDTALFNAGVVGFVNLLEAGNIEHKIEGDELEINPQSLINADLAELYLEKAVNKFEKTTTLYTVYEDINKLLNYEVSPEEFKKAVSNITKVLKSASIATGIKILENEGLNTNLATLTESLKEEKDTTKSKEILKEINEKLQLPYVKQTLYMKSIMYSKINMIWEGVSFLNRGENVKNIKQAFNDYFVQPLIEMINHEKPNKTNCKNCNSGFGELQHFSHLKDIGIDSKRKRSPFWDFYCDIVICPLCNFIFACAPLGFNSFNQDLVFINKNRSINDLCKANAKQLLENVTERTSYRYKIINQLIVDEIELKKEQEITNNIQVLIKHRNSKGYKVDIIDSSLINYISDNKKDIMSIGNIFYRVDGSYLNLLEETLDCLFRKISFLPLIIKCLRAENITFSNGVFQLIKLQIKRKEDNSMGYRIVRAKEMWEEGFKIKQIYEGENQNKNKLTGTIYKLINAVRVNDINTFNFITMKLYSNIGRSIPDKFIEIFNSDESFSEIGSAFIYGLLGGKSDYKKESKGEENE